MDSTSFEIPAFILSTLCLLYSLTAKRRQYILPRGWRNLLLSQHFVFLLSLSSLILSTVASLGGAHLLRLHSPQVIFWRYFLHACYFFFHTLMSVSFCLYILNATGTSAARGRRFFLFFSLPFLLSELLVLTNPITGFAFYMDSGGNYHRGALMPLLYAFGCVYIVLGLFFFFRYRQAVSRADSLSIGAVIVIGAAGVVVQALRPAYQVELFFESIAFFSLMVLLEERSGYIDPVTGALNRVALFDANRRMMETGQTYRLILLHLTNLDAFSGLFGGREIDQLLLHIFVWLSGLFSAQDVYHYRTRDFAVVCADPNGGAEAAARAILDRFGRDWHVGAAALRLEASVSVIRVPEDISQPDELNELLSLRHQMDRPGLADYGEISGLLRKKRLEQVLRRAMDEGKLRVWYQPIWSVEEQRTVSAEALLRVDDEELRNVSPEEYIPIAETCGLIRDIGFFVFESVCRFLQKERGLAYIEINLSVYQFLYDDLIDCLESIRARYGIPAEALNLEITESASTQSAAAVLQSIDRLRSLGYTFSLDDFGTGYSNLVQLINSSYKNVKMDKSLLWDAERNSATAHLLDSLIRVIRSLGCNVVQEGVETTAQLERTASSGGNLIQGYYFSRPLPEEEFIAYLKAERQQRKAEAFVFR